MAKMINVGILLLFLVVAAVTPHTTEAAEHIVQWIIPPEGASFYSNSLANTKFTLNDIIVFNFTTKSHNVVTLGKKDYEDCNVKARMETYNMGPARIKLNRTGDFYFACAFTSHCTLGQKLTIDVAATSSSPPMAPAEAPSSPALSFTASSSLLIMAFAINGLF